MKKLYNSLLVFGMGALPFLGSAQIIYSEDFDGISGPTAGGAGTYTFAPGYLLRNVDNGTPNAQVAYVNEAWERREDFKFNVLDSAAFSTSWISPVVPANDWMWTPLIGPLPANAQLSWNAVAYDPAYRDGYEVRIMVAPTVPTGGTGTIGNQITNSTSVFSVAAENATWTGRNVPLNAYAGQSIYVGFRNNSTDKFLLLVDDIKVEVPLLYDAQVLNVDTITEYTMIPKTQIQPLVFESDIRNNGALAMTNVTLNAKVYNQSNVEVYSASSAPQASLAAGATSHFVVAGWTPPSNEQTYTVKLFADATETDQLNGNDTASAMVNISESTYARDNGNVTGALGIGAGNGGYVGQDFLMVNAGRVASVGIFYNVGYPGRRYAAAIWDMAGGIPNQIVATTDTLIYPDDSADFYILPIHNGPYTFAPGRYAVTAIEFPSDSTISIGLASAHFTTNRTWVDWPTSPFPGWANNEDFGAGYSKSYVIRPEVLPLCPAALVTNSSISDAACGGSDGGVDLTVIAGNYTYLWSNGDTTADLADVIAGSYSVTITNTDLVCTQVANYNVNSVNGPALVSIDGSSVDCFGDEGSASIQISGGTAPFTYQWSNGDATASITDVAGSYTVTVTDDNGCVLSAGPVDITQPAEITAAGSATPADCFGDEGTASVTAGGGTAPYTYLWSNGDVTASTNDVAGSYTVTITDNNGCTATSAAIVITAPNAVTGTTTFTGTSCPTCTDGTASVTPNGGTAPYTYSWSPSGGTGATANNLAAGTYTVTITDANGCEGTATVTVTAGASVEENGTDAGIQAFPNPSNGTFYITSDINYSGKALVEIMDITGKVLHAQTVVMNNSLSNTSIHLEYAAAGTYMMRFTAGTQTFFRKLVIK